MNNNIAGSAHVFIIFSIVLSASAQLLMRAGMLEFQPLKIVDVLSILPSALWVLTGLACYAASMLCWLLALQSYPLSFAYPMLSISYILVYIGAVFWQRLGESYSHWKTSGILLIMIGVMLVARTQNNQKTSSR